ncbi:pentatricopeptide repeat-containing protein At5g66520-like [Euphorbia lathyris]|uniref:pentatricopeptide repeat-containing protein At5g66520-like n=1 Tax=Euphorbia lathyris TaxID=212925 RepID=UPI003313214A
MSYPQLSASGTRIINFLENCIFHPQLKQIQAQIILHKLHWNTTIAHHFITACQNLSLLHSSLLPLFFTHFSKPHVFTCNTLLRAFSHSQIPHIPFSIYSYMHANSIQPNHYTFPFLLKSVSDFKHLIQGQFVQAHVVKLGHLNDIFVQNSLLNVYASCGQMVLCRKLFDEMPDRDVVSWTILIMGYRDAENYDDSLISFEQMQYAGVVPNRVTMVNVLGACASFGAIEMGTWIHDFIRRNGWEVDVILGTSLIDMYMKCGRIDEGLNVFGSMKERNIFAWNAIIKGLGFAKFGQEAVCWFNRMEQQGLEPDEVTLLNVLSACSHSGMVHMGQQIFSSLVNGGYRFPPNAKHYSCMIDLFARAGYLDEAFKFIRGMPFEPTKPMWGSLLTGCRAHNNLEFSEFVARKLIELEPQNSAYYVILSNLYSEMGKWEDAAQVRELMISKGLKKDLGSSSVESESRNRILNYQCA